VLAQFTQGYSALQHRDFRLLWTGMSTSLIGDGILLVALAVFQDWLFPRDHRPSNERIVDEMVQFMVHGLARRGTVTQ